jgi:uncharacterized membrane protein YphA (DoxX/SURF4 family)
MFLAPLPLRLLLAATFIWAGLGKIVATMPVQGEQAALLANMGYAFPTPAPAPDQPTPDPTPESPAQPEPAQPEPTPPTEAAPPPAEPASVPPPLDEHARAFDAGPRVLTVQHTAIARTAAEFPDPIEVRRLYGLALLTYRAAHPTPNPDGTLPRPMWPDWAARDHWPITLAWAAAISELVAGVLVLVGLLTRISALAIAFIMASAMWLTEIGPAVQLGDAILGFLPRRDPWDVTAWRTILWQLALFGAALALAFAGPGAISIDGVASDHDDDLEDDDE